MKNVKKLTKNLLIVVLIIVMSFSVSGCGNEKPVSESDGSADNEVKIETLKLGMAGLDINKDVEFIYLDSMNSIMEAVKKGEMDLGFVNSGFGYIAKKAGLDVAGRVGEYVSDFPCCRQTTSGSAITNKRDALVKFEVAVLRGLETYMNDHDATVKALAEYSGQDEEYVKAIMYGLGDEYKAAFNTKLHYMR